MQGFVSMALRNALLIAAVASLLGAAGCGVKGPLENPVSPAADTPEENQII